MSENPIAGWYNDPAPGSSMLRYWDGNQWTEEYAEAHNFVNVPDRASDIASDSALDAASDTALDTASGSQVPGAAETQQFTQQSQQGVRPVAPPAFQQSAYNQQYQPHSEAPQQYHQPYSQQPPQQPQQPIPTDSYYLPTPGLPPSNGIAVAALILGIIGVLFFGLFATIPAIVCGVLGRRVEYQRGMATAGMILGIVGTVLWVFIFIILIVALSFFSTVSYW